jgi:hypothetical protein
MTRMGLKHLIAIVATTAFLAVAFGTLGVLVVREIERRAEWQQIRDDVLRGLPAYLGERREPKEEP